MVRRSAGARARIAATAAASRVARSRAACGSLAASSAAQRPVRRAGGQQQLRQDRRQAAAVTRHRGGILAVERTSQRGPCRPGNARIVQQNRNQRRQCQIEAGPRQAHRSQRLRADQHDLGIGGRIVAADQLDAGLGNLPVRRKLAAAHAQALPGVGQPQRPRRLGEPCRGDARHLRRGVGPQPHHALAHRVHQPERLFGDRGARAGQQAVLEFQQRRLDPLVAVAANTSMSDLDRRCLGFGIGRQQVAQTGGQQRTVVRRSSLMPASAISYRSAAKPPRHRRGGSSRLHWFWKAGRGRLRPRRARPSRNWTAGVCWPSKQATVAKWVEGRAECAREGNDMTKSSRAGACAARCNLSPRETR